jgi:hypothetical protein
MTELDGNQLYERFHRKDLDRLSMDQLTIYCRELEASRAHFAKELRAAKDHARKLGLLEKDKHRPLHHPKDPNPNPGTWTCFHPQTTRKGNKDEPCGNSNPHYERRVLWVEVMHCKTCKGLYHKDFESQKLKTPRKKYYKPKAKASEAATPDARQSPADDQANGLANAQTNDLVNAQANDFPATSITHQDPLIGASSGQLHGYLAEDDRDDTHHLSPGLHSDYDGLQHTPVSDRFHSTRTDDPFSSIHRSTADYSPMHSPGFQNSDIGYTDALNLEIDFTGQDGEFDEFAINSDPLFMDMDVEPDPQHAGSFAEQTNISQENLPQLPQNSAQLPGHYPAQVALFPQELGSRSQNQTSPSLPNLFSVVGHPIYGTGSVSASSPNQQHEYSRSLEATRLGQVDKPYKPPHGPTSPSTLPQYTDLGTVRPAGTQLSFPQSGGMVPLNSVAAAWPPEVTSSAGLHPSLQEPVLHPMALPNMQTTMSTSYPNQIMNQTEPAITIRDTNSEGLITDGQTETSGPSYPWSSRRGRRPSPIPKSPKAKKVRGPAWRVAINADSSLAKKRRVPSKTPTLSKVKTAVDKKAALKDLLTKTREPERPLTESQINQIHTRNNTSAMFLGGPRKSWQEPIESYPPKVIIEIFDDEAAVQDASEVPQGAVADQDASDALDEAFLAEFNAEFDRQDRAAALGVLDEEGEGENEKEAEMSGDDESRRGDRVIALAATAAVAEESEESEEE